MELVSLPLRPLEGRPTALGSKSHRGVLSVLVVCLFGSLGLKASLVTAVVQGNSMTPTLKSGQRLLATKVPLIVHSVRDGDIVVIGDPSDGYIVKRVYKSENEVVDTIYSPVGSASGIKQPYTVPAGEVFVLGDNLEGSEDSRIFGPVPISQIAAKVVLY